MFAKLTDLLVPADPPSLETELDMLGNYSSNPSIEVFRERGSAEPGVFDCVSSFLAADVI